MGLTGRLCRISGVWGLKMAKKTPHNINTAQSIHGLYNITQLISKRPIYHSCSPLCMVVVLYFALFRPLNSTYTQSITRITEGWWPQNQVSHWGRWVNVNMPRYKADHNQGRQGLRKHSLACMVSFSWQWLIIVYVAGMQLQTVTPSSREILHSLQFINAHKDVAMDFLTGCVKAQAPSPEILNSPVPIN